MTRKIILAALAALAIFATAACGSSNAPSPNLSSVYSTALHRCMVSDLQWAKHFVATLPTPGTPAEAAKLAASGCHYLAALAVLRAERH